MKDKLMFGSDGEPVGYVTDLGGFGVWEPPVTQVRQAILGGWIMGCDLGDDITSISPGIMTMRGDEVNRLGLFAIDAVRNGRVIDFGYLPNDVLMYSSKRAGPLYTAGHIGHPFRDTWIMYHTWDGGPAAYLVHLLDQDKVAGGDFEVVELQPMSHRGQRALMIGDRVLCTPDASDADNLNRYVCAAIPSPLRFVPGFEAMNRGMSPAVASAGNVLDPAMTGMLILSTRGVPRVTVQADAKLQKARAKNGKPSIPPYDVVQSALYVSAITARKERGRSISGGGTHASPIMHLRMGHPRTYASGQVTFVRDALINATDEAKAAFLGRSHYKVR